MLERYPQKNETEGWAQTHTDREVYHDIRHRAYLMRQNPTAAENRLWQHLRRRQINGYRFRRQHPIGRFIVDFYCAKAKLAIEVDGPVHNEPGHKEYDQERQAYLESLGLRVLRITNEEVLNGLDAVLNEIRVALGR